MIKHGSSISSESKSWAFIAYLLSVIGFILIMLTRKQDHYAMYHAKQSLVLFFATLIAMVIGMVPILGWIISWMMSIIILILWILGMIHALNGKQIPLPLIGHFADAIKL